jgi:RNA polymerase sigma factor (sigma-70 family)
LREVFTLAFDIVRRRGRAVLVEAEDIASEVVEQLLDPVELDRIREPAAFRGYVATLTVRRIFDRLRSPARKRRVAEHSDAGQDDGLTVGSRDPNAGPPDVAGGREAWGIVLEALERMSETCRTVLLAYIEHLFLDPKGSYLTLTRALKCTRGTVSSRVRRCLDKLLEDRRVRSALGLPED